MKKTHKIIMLPIEDKNAPIIVFKDQIGIGIDRLGLHKEYNPIHHTFRNTLRHLYIIDNSKTKDNFEIKYKDWYTDLRKVYYCQDKEQEVALGITPRYFHKILASTDSFLNLSLIPNDFIIKYCNHPVEEVMVEYKKKYIDFGLSAGYELKTNSNNEIIADFTDKDFDEFHKTKSLTPSEKYEQDEKRVLHPDNYKKVVKEYEDVMDLYFQKRCKEEKLYTLYEVINLLNKRERWFIEKKKEDKWVDIKEWIKSPFI